MADEDLLEDKPRGKWKYAWFVWLVVVVGGFLAIEIPAIANKDGGDTLTEHVQYVAGTGWWATILIAGGLVGLFAWLMPHFFGPDSRVWKWMKWRKEQDEDADA